MSQCICRSYILPLGCTGFSHLPTHGRQICSSVWSCNLLIGNKNDLVKWQCFNSWLLLLQYKHTLTNMHQNGHNCIWSCFRSNCMWINLLLNWWSLWHVLTGTAELLPTTLALNCSLLVWLTRHKAKLPQGTGGCICMAAHTVMGGSHVVVLLHIFLKRGATLGLARILRYYAKLGVLI